MGPSQNQPREKRGSKSNDHRRQDNAINAARIFHGALGPRPNIPTGLDESMLLLERDVVTSATGRFFGNAGSDGRMASRCPWPDISVNSFARFDIGQSKHVIHTNKNGKVIHEGILSRLDTEEFPALRPRLFLGRLTTFVTESTTPVQELR